MVEQNWQSGDWNGCKDEILRYTGILFTLMVWRWRLLSSITGNAEITQGTLKKLREKNVQQYAGFSCKIF